MHLDAMRESCKPRVAIPRVPIMLLKDERDAAVGTIARLASGYCVISSVVELDRVVYIGLDLLRTKDVAERYRLKRRSPIRTWLGLDPWDETFEIHRNRCVVRHSGVPVLDLRSKLRRYRNGKLAEFFVVPTVHPMGVVRADVMGGPVQVSYKSALNKLGIPKEALEAMTSAVL